MPSSKITPARESGTSSRTWSTVTRRSWPKYRSIFLQLVLDLAGVPAGEQHEKIERFLVELQFSRFRTAPHDLRRFLFPARARRIEPIDHLHLGALGQRLVERTALVGFRRADQQSHVSAQTRLEHLGQILERALHRSRTPDDAIAQAICVLQPDQFAAAEKRERLQRLDRQPDFRDRLIDVIRAGIDHFHAEFARIGRRQFRRQLRRDAFYLAFVRADDRVNAGFGLRCFGFSLRHSWRQF